MFVSLHLETPEHSLYEGMTVPRRPTCLKKVEVIASIANKDDELCEKVEVHPKPVYGYSLNAPIMQVLRSPM